MIEPVAALRNQIGRIATSDWSADEQFVEPSFRSHAFLLEAARDTAVIAAFRSSQRKLIFDPGHEFLNRPYSMYELAPSEDETGPLKEPALAVLIGLAVIAATTEIIGLAGRDARKRAMDDVVARRREIEPPPRPVPDEVDLGEDKS